MGAFILVTPLLPSPSWESRPEEHIRDTLAIIRKAERPWAWRCLFALIVLLMIIASIVTGVLLSQRHKSS